MPPTSAVRKNSGATDTSRRQSGRQARTTTSRPINYYARPYGTMSGPVDEPREQEPGFFPAITYFADAITALPKEVQRHVSLMKEVEAKVYGPTEALNTLSSTILRMPTPPPRSPEPSMQGLLSLTTSNSTTASLNGSVINGFAPAADRVSDILDGANSKIDEHADLARRSQFRNLRQLIGAMIVNLDEKNNVMAEANRVLAQQLSRMDSVMPHVESEISEDARLGSLTHWAYAENRVKKPAPPVNERARRDVAATSNLAAAAAAVHDNDIAAARGQATREGKKTRNNNKDNHVDSDFDDKPSNKRAAPAKARKEAAELKTRKDAADHKAAASSSVAATGLGITNGTSGAAPAKRRKIEKPTAPAMERSASGAGAASGVGALKNGRGGNTTPRSTPQTEPVKQKKKPGPAPGFVPVKKRNQALNSGANSPAQPQTAAKNSSPVLNAAMPDLSSQRPALARNRQNSSTSNLQYSLLAGGEKEHAGSRPSSSAGTRSANGANGNASVNGNGNGNGENGDSAEAKTAAEETEQQQAKLDRTQVLKNEDAAMSDAQSEQPARGGRRSKTSTPLNSTLPADGAAMMVRTRSSRGTGTNSRSDVDQNGTSSARPSHSRTPEAGAQQKTPSQHRKNGSGAHILKQIASFNRSPDLDRHQSIPGEPTSDVDSDDEERNHVRERVHGKGKSSGSGSGSTSGSVSGGGGRSSSRRSAPRTVASISAAATLATGGRSSRSSRARNRDTEQPRSTPHSAPHSAAHSRSRNRTPEDQQDAGIEADEIRAGSGVEDQAGEEEEEDGKTKTRESAVQKRMAEEEDDEDVEEEEEEEEEDPNEPRYCYCGQGSFGEMIACDNNNCTMEWFHLQCTGLRSVPADNVKWYCDVCKESMAHTGRGKKGRPASRHAASAGH